MTEWKKQVMTAIAIENQRHVDVKVDWEHLNSICPNQNKGVAKAYAELFKDKYARKH